MRRIDKYALTGQVVAVTGGARGIGLATAQELLRRGARVAIGDIDEDAARKAAVHLGVNCLGMSLDVTNRESFDSFLDRVTAEVGPIDVLVNNAGIMPLGPIENEADALTRRIVDVNLHGPILGPGTRRQRLLRGGTSRSCRGSDVQRHQVRHRRLQRSHPLRTPGIRDCGVLRAAHDRQHRTGCRSFNGQGTEDRGSRRRRARDRRDVGQAAIRNLGPPNRGVAIPRDVDAAPRIVGCVEPAGGGVERSRNGGRQCARGVRGQGSQDDGLRPPDVGPTPAAEGQRIQDVASTLRRTRPASSA
jgi:hypothetical protein